MESITSTTWQSYDAACIPGGHRALGGFVVSAGDVRLRAAAPVGAAIAPAAKPMTTEFRAFGAFGAFEAVADAAAATRTHAWSPPV
ncbi:MAG TPA: hypothetical protein VGE77_13525 [Nocardioides sp.]